MRHFILGPRAVVAIILLVALGETFARAQAAVSFDTASIKLSEPGNVRGATFQFLPGGGLRVVNGTLKGLIESAYDVRDFQILGATGWMGSERFDVSAKSPAGVSAGDGSENIKATRLRLQSLLAERFRLRIRRERRDIPEYSLRIAKGGLRLVAEPRSADGIIAPGGIDASCGRMIGMRASMSQLAAKLSREVSRPVIDDTALDGRYSFQFEWAPDVGPCSVADPAVQLSTSQSIFTALEERLGLKLESITGPVDVVVIAAAERPSPD